MSFWREKRLRERREMTGGSQTEIALMLGTHQSIVSGIELHGPRNPRERRIAEEMDRLLPPFIEAGSHPLTDEERDAVKVWLDERIAASTGVRKSVAADMKARLT